MKRLLYLLIPLLLFSNDLCAQSITLHMKSGGTHKYMISEVDYIDFNKDDKENDPAEPAQQTTIEYYTALEPIITSLIAQLDDVNKNAKTIEANYTGINSSGYLKAPVSPNDSHLYSFWQTLYRMLNLDRQVLQNLRDNENILTQAMCDILDVLTYEELVNYFGNVVFLSEDMDMFSNVYQTAASQIIDNLISRLSTSISTTIDRKCADINGNNMIEYFGRPSRDLTSLLLAELYINKGNYAQAKTLLSGILETNRYSVQQNQTRSNLTSDEHILTITKNDGSVVIRTFTDVLLLMAECEYQLGNNMASSNYINMVASAKGVDTDSAEPLKAIAKIRRSLQDQTNGYFAYMKRCGLAQPELGLEQYQLLLPIPYSELMMNPNLVQNPGY